MREAQGSPRLESGGRRPRRRPDVLERKAGRDLVLYDPEHGRLHVLNPTAAVVWSLCDGDTLVSEMRSRLEAFFRVVEGTDIRRDVEELLRCLYQNRLLTDDGLTRPGPRSAAAGGEQ